MLLSSQCSHGECKLFPYQHGLCSLLLNGRYTVHTEHIVKTAGGMHAAKLVFSEAETVSMFSYPSFRCLKSLQFLLHPEWYWIIHDHFGEMAIQCGVPFSQCPRVVTLLRIKYFPIEHVEITVMFEIWGATIFQTCPVNAKFACSCTSSCCLLQNILPCEGSYALHETMVPLPETV
jgi:hypothetical protein